MTHDELLAKLSQDWNGTPFILQALEAVVELHKPIKIGGKQLCDSCELWTNEGAAHSRYPCPTIQAIEKELG